MRIPSYYHAGDFKNFESDLESLGICEFYKKGEFLNSSGEYMDYAFYIKSGILRYYNVNDCGNEKTVWFIGKDSIFPLYSPIEHEYRIEKLNSMVEAVSDTFVIKIKQSDLLAYIRQNSDFAIAMLKKYADLAGLLLYESLNFSTRNNFINVCNYLYHYESVLKPNGIVLTQEEMAAQIGTTPLSLARTLKTLRERGIVSTKRKVIDVTDMSELKKLCNGDIVP